MILSKNSLLKKFPWSKDPHRDQEIAANQVYIAALAKCAKECLSDPKFSDYLSMFEIYKVQVIEDIISLNDEDPIKYAFKVRQLVDTLKACRLLMSSVQEDAQTIMEG